MGGLRIFFFVKYPWQKTSKPSQTEEQEAEDKKLFDEIRAKEDKKLEDMMVLVNQLSKTSRYA